MTYEEALKELATSYGIAPQYTSISGQQVVASTDTLVKLLRAMGVDLGDSETPTGEEVAAAAAAHRAAQASLPLPETIAVVEGDPKIFNVHVHHGAPARVDVELEDGGTREVAQEENWSEPVAVGEVTWGEATFRLPADLPTGYHRLRLTSGERTHEARLIVSPARLATTDRFVEDKRFGVMAQLYSARSAESWGIGDFHDLGHLAEVLAEEIGADFLQINPLHAAEPLPPVEDSPYLPTTRRFTNPIYLRIEDIPEYGQLDAETRAEIQAAADVLRAGNTSAEPIERNPIYQLKLDTLHVLHELDRSPQRQRAFEDYVATEGPGLVDFARWCAQRELDQQWAERRHAIAPEITELAGFYMWLQFLCDEQLAAAQRRALDAGMAIGIMTDLAVGVHPGGADAETLRPWLAPDASVGAPPDPFNQQGQDWSQPPWNPAALPGAEYEPWRAMLQTVLRHSGGIRVDHVIGLFRLFWMPRMEHPSTGAYVNYDFEAMLGVLTLEAERAGAVVIGEDLGTVEPWVRDVLAARGVMGTSVLWFESGQGGEPLAQGDYRTLALASVGTHDLPPTAGYLQAEHIHLRERLGLLETDADKEDADDLHWQGRVLATAQAAGAFAGTGSADVDFHRAARDQRGSVEDLIVGLHRFMAGTPAALMVTNLVDLVGETRTQNQPGTNSAQYPNWCIPLADAEGDAVLIGDLATRDLLHRVGQASARS
ncbi:4-alpha-glucanotransferase [Corynebacterium guangdongense]|uniref:4-alpha-glucanotransferase n=1 Tax=Corynebacterium guangdongense TaxID=1783348 RepID=A0ABU2A0F5_9CORY|nr:4-alpha-glucanotransferase [Corynebacterium guangdongense]MDR7329982.1 4-alpha-glucanotransferase [Corynebacterium guangdongense]WJZ18540.1 4-alpha-glucanotransferase [Corynebacterium guangdongense]